MQKIFTEERSHIFVKEPEGSSEKTLKYTKCTYGRIFIPSQKNKFMIYACAIFRTFKLIEPERYGFKLDGMVGDSIVLLYRLKYGVLVGDTTVHTSFGHPDR